LGFPTGYSYKPSVTLSQVDTVRYPVEEHVSYGPYSGEVALHMLGFHLKTVTSVEIGEVKVDHTQSGMLINSVDREVSH
jgi:hypothetical protein